MFFNYKVFIYVGHLKKIQGNFLDNDSTVWWFFMYKDSTDEIDLKSCLNDFVAGSEHRNSIFGQF